MTAVVRVSARALVGAALLVVAGCGPPPAVQSPPPVSETAGRAAPVYRLQVGDSIRIDFLTDDSLGLETPVTPAGTVTLPLAGDIDALGKTVEELAADIKERMSPYLIDGGVSVVIVTVGAQPIFVIGEVRTPGRVDTPGPITVSRAVATAGGLLPTARPGSVMVVRTEGVEEPTAYRIDLASVLSARDLAQDIELRPNDVVFVPKSLIADVGGFVSLFFENIIPAQLSFLYGYDMTHLENRAWR
jgi:protein involved in polysaccharide export with SLBB domain